MSAEKDYLINGQIPLDLARAIGGLVSGSFSRALDPCVGDGSAFYQIARGWKAAGYGIEPEQTFSGHGRQALGFGNFLSAQFEDCVVKGFPLAYVNPPIEKRREINWIKRVWEAMVPGGIAVWLLPEKTTKVPEWLTKFSTFFGDTEVFRIPDQWKGPVGQLILRTRPREQNDLASDPVRIQMLLEACEKANVLSTAVPAWGLPPIAREHQNVYTFKVRSLEWDDIYRDLMQVSYPHLEEMMELPSFSHFDDYRIADEAIKDPEKHAEWLKKHGKEPKPPEIRPYTISDGAYIVWVDALLTAEKEILFISMTGRLAHIRLVEMVLKSGKSVKLGYTNVALDGKMRHWRKIYQNFVFRLPQSGAYQSIWVHTNLTGKMSRGNSIIPICPGKNKLTARLMSSSSGLPVMPEWIEDIVAGGNSMVYVQDCQEWNMDAAPRKPSIDNLRARMSHLAKVGNLPEPTPGEAEIIRPLMPPSTGGYAQLALQQFINCYPLKGEGTDRFVIYAKPMLKEDVEISDVMNDKVEITTITRKDAVHVELFHYAGAQAGEWEVFETGAGDEEEDDQTNPTQAP